MSSLGALSSGSGRLLPTEEQLQELWGLCQQGYQETRTQQRLDRLPKAMFLKEPVSTQWPVWRAKGAVTRHFAPALLYGVTRLGLPMAPFFQLVLQALMGLVGFYKELEAWRNLQVLSPPVASALQRHIGQLQGALMKLALEQTQLWFNVTPKCNYLKHLGQQCVFHHVWWTTTYQEEGYIGRIVKVARGSASGQKQLAIPAVVIAKYRILLCLLWGGLL